VFVDTAVSGTVVSVQNYNGEQYLRLDDGRQIRYLDVREVVNPDVMTTQD
jgi:hypothetical protein